MSLETLPPELYLAILSHVPHSHLKMSALNLSRAIPRSPVPLRVLFEQISVSHQEQLPQLYRRLRYSPTGLKNIGNGVIEEATWVKSFSVLTWQVDADVLLNTIALLPALGRLSVRIGPVFTPEHLEDIFKEPMISLNLLDLRFRPYVKTASYYQFLKGSYFDSTLDLISTWPSNSSLSRFSIIVDPLPQRQKGADATFAQPIVFFSLTPLTRISISPATRNVTHVRLRVPSRHLVRFIASRPRSRNPFPNATLLDLSTSWIRSFDELELLLNFVGGGDLQHLILDHTGLCDGGARNWEMLGRTCALAGVKHSREHEKALRSRAQDDTMVASDNQGGTHLGPPEHAQHRPARRGRRGLATATISLRDHPTTLIASTLPSPSPAPHKPTKIRIRPSPPRLLSLCVSLPLPAGENNAEEIRSHETDALTDFARGWSEGIRQLRSIWTRLRQSQLNGVKVFRFDIEGKNESSGDNILHGLVEMCGLKDDKLWEELDTLQPPVLCFSGTRGEHFVGNEWPGHPNNCGHRISSDVWGDNL